MRIYSWNVNGIRAIHNKGFLKWFNKTRPDILCLQEIKAKEKDFPEKLKNLTGYNIYISEAKKPGYAGTAILSKIKPQQIITKIGIKKFDDEGRFTLLKFPKFSLFNTYFPHSRLGLERLDFKLQFNKAYINFIKKIKDNNLILTGDFNVAHKEIDLANPKENTKNAGFTSTEREFIDQLIKLGWIDTYRYFHPVTKKYTWWTWRFNARKRNIGWRIDYFFAKKNNIKRIKTAEIHDQIYGSDHCPISINLLDKI